jgi:hypothetical protein
VRFQLNDLCRAETDISIRKALQNLPRDLGETYGRLLARIDNAEQREYVKRMFQWIICARRPLEIEELREAIAFTLEDDYFDLAKIPNDLNRLARACGNLIVIDEDENTVQIAHYTMEQYLLAEHDCHRHSFFWFTREQAHLEVGKVCVAYLSFSDFDLQLTQHKDTTTSHFAALEDVVRKESMLPAHSKAAKVVKASKLFRGPQGTSTNIEFDRYISGSKTRSPVLKLTTKYRLLSYVAENWLHHTTMTREACEVFFTSSPRHFRLFSNLALEKVFPLDIRPWESIPLRWDRFPFVLQLGWAISSNHLPLLHAIAHKEIGSGLGLYFDHVTRVFEDFKSLHRAGTGHSFRDFSKISTETWPTSKNWESWIFSCIFKASERSFADVLKFIVCNWREGTQPTLLRTRLFTIYLFLEAKFCSHTSTVEVLTDTIRVMGEYERFALLGASKQCQEGS